MSVLSTRAESYIAKPPSPMVEWTLKASSNEYSKENPEGIINLGTAANSLMAELVIQRITKPDASQVTPKLLDYIANVDLEGVIAEYFTKHLSLTEPLTRANVFVTNGVSCAMDCISNVTCSPGDVLLIGTPHYGVCDTDLCEKSEVKLIKVHTYSNSEGGPFRPTVQDYERSLLAAKEKGENVRGIFIINPHNPMGSVLSEKELQDIAQLCAKYEIHLISDEIYMLSTLKTDTKFTSVLELEGLNPDFVHVLWGFSKDFGVPGLCTGCIISRSKPVMQAAFSLIFFYRIPNTTAHMLKVLLQDQKWLDDTFFPTQKRLLTESLKTVTDALKDLSIPFILPEAGIFVMANFKKCLNELSQDGELEFLKRLVQKGVYITPGHAFRTQEEGWFRIVFAVPQEKLRLGLQRLNEVLNTTANS